MNLVSSHECRVEQLKNVATDVTIMLLSLEEPESFAFAAGQYVSLIFEGLPARDFSIANLPGELPLEFHLRRVSGGAVSNHLIERLNVGDRVTIKGPYGEAYLRLDHDGPILAIAGSTGLAPIKSIVGAALIRGITQPIYLYYGVREEQDLYLLDHFKDLTTRHPNLNFIPALSQELSPSSRRKGLIVDVLTDDFDNNRDLLAGCMVYLAGPPVMVEAGLNALVRLGVSAEDCISDPFYSNS